MTAFFDNRAEQDATAIPVMRRLHAVRLALCDRLEAIADSLPNDLDRRECLVSARALGPRFFSIHRFEEQRIFPLFCARLGHSEEAQAIVERLKNEHVEDEGYATELREALRTVARAGRAENSETLGFMLRGFFGAVRRHVAFEQDHMLAVLGNETELEA
ncbi:hemerythrin domain-containing protein [Aminobacter sp. HY435]|uniref:hemerythrin domain-containing protein n=1 Tax=Aminobacter sp. HY435 TaxID=2970917 RepID=UPI0022B97F01|nr:hemerythrin domain-containing protein [Aminobacter sp. HY435]